MERRSFRSAPAQKTPGTAEPRTSARVVKSSPDAIGASVLVRVERSSLEIAFLASGREKRRSLIRPVCGAGMVVIVIGGSEGEAEELCRVLAGREKILGRTLRAMRGRRKRWSGGRIIDGDHGE
jgi:hypothetical protein